MGCNMDFSKWRPKNLHEMEYLVFHYYFVFFGKTIICIFRKSRFPVRSVSLLMYCCLLPSSATVKIDNEENMENARYATKDDTPFRTND